MSDTSTSTQPQSDDDKLAGLREAARLGKAAAEENVDLKRRLFFVENGVDLTTTGGKMLFQTWQDGGSVEDLLSQAKDVNTLKATTPPVTEPAADPARQQEDDARRNAQQGFAGGQGSPPPNEPTGEHPVMAAIHGYHESVRGGQMEELAARDAFSKVLGSNDPRMRYDQEAHLAAGREADRMFEGRTS